MLSIFRNDPFPSLALMNDVRRELDRFLGDHEAPVVGHRFRAVFPKIDTNTEEHAYVLTAEVPGIPLESIELSVHEGVITLSGQRAIDVPEGYTARRRERSDSRFTRSIRLPEDADSTKTEATLENGVLRVRVHKRPEAQPRTITINA